VGDHLTDVVTYAVIGFIGFRLATGLRRSLATDGRALIRQVVTGIRWRHVWPAPLLLPVVVAAAYVLMLVPGLNWGWWTALGGDGNPVFGSSSSTAGTTLEWLVPVVFVGLLLPTLPLFAYAEERMFRQGAEAWSQRRRLVKIVQFGLMHALIGIPIGAAIALSIGGAYFMGVYLRAFRRGAGQRGATIESTRAHTVYNAMIILLVVGAVAAVAVIDTAG
jgi:hypothetical protein